jgi:hypothetical protein
MSVDGFVAANDPKFKWPLWDWGPQCPWDEELKDDFNAIFKSVDSILPSRPMVNSGYIDHWTETADAYSDNPLCKFAKRVVGVEKTVVTNKSIRNNGSARSSSVMTFRKLSQDSRKGAAEISSSLVEFGSLRPC